LAGYLPRRREEIRHDPRPASRRLELAPDTPLAEIVNVLKGATVAKGEVVGRFETRGLADGPAPARADGRGEASRPD